MKKLIKLGFGLYGAGIMFLPSLQAASDTWSGATDGNWATTTNWVGGVAPGATTGTTNSDTATFDSTSANSVITIDSGRVIQNVTFDTASVGSYTLGSAGANSGNTLKLASGGTMGITATVPNGVVVTVNAPLSLGGNYTINNQATSNARFEFAGNITNTATSTITFLSSTGTGVNVFSGVISNGVGVTSMNFGQFSSGSGSATVELTGNNTYSGQTFIDFLQGQAAGVGNLITSGTNSSNGTTNLSHGTLTLNNASNGGLASGLFTIGSGAWLQAATASAGTLSNNISLSNNSSVSGSNNITFNGDFTTTTNNRSLSNAMTAGTLTFNGKFNIGSATGSGFTAGTGGSGNTVINGVIQDYSGGVGTAAGNMNYNPTGSGVITVNGANTYTGTTTISGSGKVVVSNIGNSGSSSNLGSFGTVNLGATTVGGTLAYVGTGETSNKVINLSGSTGGATLEQAGTGVLKFTSNTTAAASSKTLTLQGSTAGTGEISGIISNGSGTVGVTKAGTGTWTLSGANTYTGATTVNGGTLKVDANAGGSLAATSALTLGGGTFLLAGNASGATTQTLGAVTLTAGTGSTLRVDGSTGSGTALTVGGLTTGARSSLDISTVNGGSVITSQANTNGILGGRITLNGSDFAAGNGVSAITAVSTTALALTGGTDTNNSLGTDNMTLAGNRTTNSLKLTNTTTGQALSLGSSTLSLASGGLLFTGPNAYSITGGTLRSTTATNSDLTVHQYGAALTIGSVIGNGSGASTLNKTGTGDLLLTGTNTYTGGTTINQGILDANTLANGGVASSIGQSTNVAGNLVINGGTLRYSGGATSTDRLFTIGSTGGTIDASGSGALTLSATGAVTLSGTNVARTVNLTGTNTGANTFAGVLGNNGAGATSLTKSGAGTWALTGTNTYTGATTVSAGTLLVNGSIAAGSAVAVTSGATLGGSGTVNGATTITNGTLSPGNSPGVLTFGSSLTLSGNSTNSVFELATGTRGTNYDGVNVAGTMTYDGTLTLSIASTLTNSTYNLFDFALDSGDFDIVAFSGAGYSGTFTDVSGVWTALAGGQQFVFSESTGDLVVSAVPEPSTYALLTMGIGALYFLRRRKKA